MWKYYTQAQAHKAEWKDIKLVDTIYRWTLSGLCHVTYYIVILPKELTYDSYKCKTLYNNDLKWGVTTTHCFVWKVCRLKKARSHLLPQWNRNSNCDLYRMAFQKQHCCFSLSCSLSQFSLQCMAHYCPLLLLGRTARARWSKHTSVLPRQSE